MSGDQAVGGTRPEWGMKASMDHMKEMWAWMQGTLVGTIDTRAFELQVHEFDWSKVNNVIYEAKWCRYSHDSCDSLRAIRQFHT